MPEVTEGLRLKLTKRSTLVMCIEWWLWLAENPDKKKQDWPGLKSMEIRPASFCPCCEYNNRNFGNYCNASCLIQWPGGYCMNDTSPYYSWIYSINDEARKKYAMEIVKLAQEALARLPEGEE